MKFEIRLISFILFCMLCGCGLSAAQASLQVLYTFKALGGTPTAIVEVSPGRFFGITATSPGLFSISSSGNYQFYYTFPTTSTGVSASGIAPGLNGQAYGSASNSGDVTSFSELFSVTDSGKVTTYPYNGATEGAAEYPTQSPDGYLYALFGLATTPPAFARLDYQGNPTPLYQFTTTQGFPKPPILGADGAFYGVTLMNNTMNAGVYRLTTSGSFSWLGPNFPTNGVDYMISFMQASNGNFYGTLNAGGIALGGSIYQVTPAGQISDIFEFPHPEFGIPEALIEASDGMLYGTARGLYQGGYRGYSSVFRLNPNTGEFKTIYGFQALAQGECECRITQGSDGKIYGVSAAGGTYQLGTIWALDAGLPPPKPAIRKLVPQTGAVGQKILIWGQNLLGATAVSFNGTQATRVGIASNQAVWAWVPNGATSGPVTVTTPNGSFTSAASFTVE